MPGSKNVGKNIKEMKKNHPDWSHSRIIAAALDMARRLGAKVPKKRGKKKAKKGRR